MLSVGNQFVPCISSLRTSSPAILACLSAFQAIALASLYLAANVVELAGSGVPGYSEEPFPDLDRGSAAVLARAALRWMYHRNSKTNGRTHSHVPVATFLIDLLSDAACM
jgi:hypothetical protein